MRDRWRRLELIDRLKQTGAGEPSHRCLGIRRDIDARASRNRDERAGVDPELLQERGGFGCYFLECRFAVIHQIHFVDRHDCLANPKQTQQLAVTPACSRAPSSAAITMTAASALAAPVIIFLRNSSWPGASMMT